MFDEQIDPPDDEMPWGEDFEGDEVAQGTEGWTQKKDLFRMKKKSSSPIWN